MRDAEGSCARATILPEPQALASAKIGWRAPADAFRSGYGECRAGPDVSPVLFDSLIVARGLQQLNLTLNIADIDGLTW